jgi:hypothetical protein
MNAENTFVYSPYLSKSLYIKGLQCHKALWLQKYKPELKDEVSESQQAVFDSGTEAGILAQQLFPGGTEVPYDGLTHEEQIALTQKLIADNTTTIYEATFSFNGIFVKADILHRNDDGWELYEVKSSAGLKKVHLNDIAVQYYVLNGCGINLAKAALMHINNQYVRQGDIEVRELFTVKDLTSDVIARQAELQDNIVVLRNMLQGDMPQADIGPHCSNPYECSFSGHCWQHIPENSVFELRDHGRPNPFGLVQQGILKMEDVPADMLGWRQKMQLDCLLKKEGHVDSTRIQEFLDSLRYPLCFMDFETIFRVAVPVWDGTSPYQQIPFQFSLHILDKPGDSPRHSEYLADGSSDPRPGFLTSLLASLPDQACIITWNKTFENGRLKELARIFPENADQLNQIIDNTIDLMEPFRNKSLYHWQMQGSYSLKSVLPALVPELSYDNLPISNGEMAADGWLRMVRSDDMAEKQAIREQLLQYCCLDTFAMIKILEKMKEMVVREACTTS